MSIRKGMNIKDYSLYGLGENPDDRLIEFKRVIQLRPFGQNRISIKHLGEIIKRRVIGTGPHFFDDFVFGVDFQYPLLFCRFALHLVEEFLQIGTDILL